MNCFFATLLKNQPMQPVAMGLPSANHNDSAATIVDVAHRIRSAGTLLCPHSSMSVRMIIRLFSHFSFFELQLRGVFITSFDGSIFMLKTVREGLL
jgi:hypothetical protein